MDVVVRGRNVDVPEALRAAATTKIAHVGRFLPGMDHAEIHFSEARNPRIADSEICEVTLSGHGHYVRAKAAASDALVAVDKVVDKLEHQLEKLKGKLAGRSHPRRGSLHSVASQNQPDGTDHAADDADQDPRARIVKTKQFPMKPMTPEEAALQMELLGHDFYFFTNSETHRAAVVYRRNDGDLGLIDGG